MSVTYNIDEIYKIQKIGNIINIFWELEEDIQNVQFLTFKTPSLQYVHQSFKK